MAETIFFDTSDTEASRNMASARDKQALTSGLHRMLEVLWNADEGENGQNRGVLPVN